MSWICLGWTKLRFSIDIMATSLTESPSAVMELKELLSQSSIGDDILLTKLLSLRTKFWSRADVEMHEALLDSDKLWSGDSWLDFLESRKLEECSDSGDSFGDSLLLKKFFASLSTGLIGRFIPIGRLKPTERLGLTGRFKPTGKFRPIGRFSPMGWFVPMGRFSPTGWLDPMGRLSPLLVGGCRGLLRAGGWWLEPLNMAGGRMVCGGWWLRGLLSSGWVMRRVTGGVSSLRKNYHLNNYLVNYIRIIRENFLISLSLLSTQSNHNICTLILEANQQT